MVEQLYIKMWVLKIYYTPGHTRNDTKFSDSPAHLSQLTHTYTTIPLVCQEFTEVLHERPTFPFTVENFTYSTPTKCQISRGKICLVFFVVGDLRAAGIMCCCCSFFSRYGKKVTVVNDLRATVNKLVGC